MSDLEEKERHTVMILGGTGAIGSAVLHGLAEEYINFSRSNFSVHIVI